MSDGNLDEIRCCGVEQAEKIVEAKELARQELKGVLIIH